MRSSFAGFDHNFNHNRKRFNLMFNLVIGFICLVFLIVIAWWLFVGTMVVTHGESFLQAVINLINAGANNLNR